MFDYLYVSHVAALSLFRAPHSANIVKAVGRDKLKSEFSNFPFLGGVIGAIVIIEVKGRYGKTKGLIRKESSLCVVPPGIVINA